MSHHHSSNGESDIKRMRQKARLRAGVVILVIGSVIYLLTNHWVHVLDSLPYVFGAAMLVMHLFGHGGHGGHSGHGASGRTSGHGGRPDQEGAGDVR
ncbi:MULTISPECIES: DUF2933 domain-containing protein [Kocuria]|uniref:DUF2933 domain-containing protein n=1 Tax=Kocuria TaxID=57493 RepID=UPI00117381C0|nr:MULTISPECIES: DUF2933 domain-containing protein [Kocuria]TQN33707.1 DUF2933 family protein [Kocuria rosea]WJZ66771.1 DUF2933 domain-containing protein [Kocuria rosea]